MRSVAPRVALVRLGALVLLTAGSVAGTVPRAAAPLAESDALGPAPRLHVVMAGAGPRSNGWIRVGNAGTYAGALTFGQAAGHVTVVNDLAMEDYVRGISEMPGDWPMPALEAQAIAARTYGLYHVLTNADRVSWPGSDAEICATDSCQVYRGLPDGEARTRWDAAVAATANQVLLYRGRVIEAFYASSDGGRTRGGGVPWLPSIADPDDSLSPLHHWTWTAPLASFAPVVGVPASTLVSLSSTPDAVVATVQQPGAAPAQRNLDPEQFQQQANAQMNNPPGLPLPLPGPYFSLSSQPSGAVQVEGWGFGHGLGMSQYGALGKALRGVSAGGILGAYYGPARATRLPLSHVPREVRVLVSSDQKAVTVVGSGALQVVDDQGALVGDVPTGALTVDIGPGGVRAHVIPRPPITDVPQQPPPLRGPLPTFADVRPSLLQAGAPPAPAAAPTSAPAPPSPAAAASHAAVEQLVPVLVAAAPAPAARSAAHPVLVLRLIVAALVSLAAVGAAMIGALLVRRPRPGRPQG